MKLIGLLLLSFLCCFYSFSQKKLQIIDAQSLEGIPFVSYSDAGKKAVSDIDGWISVTETTDLVHLKSFGYRDTTISVLTLSNQSKVRLVELTDMLQEIKVIPGPSPVLRLINNAIANRKTNHPKSTYSYRAETYSKFLFSMDSLFDNTFATNPFKDSIYQRWYDADSSIAKKNNLRDSLAQVKTSDTLTSEEAAVFNKFFDQSHLLLMENLSVKEFMPPFREKETIKAYKVSGFNSPYLANFANEIQAFSFYDNTFELLGSTYINPIAFGATKKYAYIIEDTIFNARGDSTFVIRFLPKINKQFDGLRGQLYLNSTSWAIEKVIAEPATKDERIFYVRIVQNYELIDNKKWFPMQLITEFSAPQLQINNKIINGKGSTTVKQIELSPELRKRDFDNIWIETSEGAGKADESTWNEGRPTELTAKEANTYQSMDSLAKKEKLNDKLKMLEYLMDGKIPMGYLKLDLNKLVHFNQYEGYRLGVGLETSEKVMKKAVFGAYFAYGTSDRDWKYGGFSEFKLHRKNEVKLKFRFQDDVVNRGMMNFTIEPRQLSLTDYYGNFYIRNKERQRLAEVSLEGKLWSNMRGGIFANYQRIQLTESYRWLTDNNEMIKGYNVAEVGAELIWTPLTKWSLIEGRYYKLKEVLPTFKLKTVKNISDWSSHYNYWRWRLDIGQNHKIFNVGTINWMLTLNKTFGEGPLTVQNTPFSSGGNWNLSVINSFETMLPNTYYATEYAAVFFRFTTESWTSKLKFFQPSLTIHHAMGIGRMNDAARHTNQLTFNTMEKGYLESGLMVNKILCASSLGLGIGGFYHYGAYAAPNFADNLMVKLSLTMSLK